MLAAYENLFSADYWSQIGEYAAVFLDWFPLWGPLLFGWLFYKLWLRYVQRLSRFKEDRILLEISLPKEQTKAPKAMELALQAFHQDSARGKFVEKFWNGFQKPWFSLELVSIEGDIHLFVWAPAFFREIIENNIYSQYPDVEITEVPDYTNFLKYDTDLFELWGANFELSEDDIVPIKTYVDYEFTGGKDEENQVDPMTPIIEYLGSLRRGEQVWIQILVTGHKKRKKSGSFFGTTSWQDEARKKVNEILERDEETKLPKNAGDENAPSVSPSLSEDEQDQVKAIERNISKDAFDCGVRGIYIAEEGQFRPVNIPGMIGAFKQFNADNRNGFKPSGGLAQFNHPWEKHEQAENFARKQIFDAYRRRSFFYPPYKEKPFVLSSEELATLYHFPGQVAQTPTFKRIESKKSQPPSDLPV